jgi:hypothetical protein
MPIEPQPGVAEDENNSVFSAPAPVGLGPGHFAEDPGAHSGHLRRPGPVYFPVEDVKKFEQTLKHQGKKTDALIDPDAGHAFENRNNTAG